MALTERAPAKINLGLHVLRRRPDGYHEIETVLHRIDWADTVSAEPADALSMSCSDPALPTDESNLCMQAARRLRDAAGVEAGARLHLEKRVPYGAGLGGGSSDAAATLRLLARLWSLEVPDERLREIAAGIGSDVPFFLQDAPAAHATGRGEMLSVLRDEKGRTYRLPYPVLVVAPPVEIATPDAYGWVTPNDEDRSELPVLLQSNDPSRWRNSLVNDFESPVLDRQPAVATAHDWLREMGADYVSLTGTGGAVFGVFRDEERAVAALKEGRRRKERVHLTMSGADVGPPSGRS